MDATLWIDLQEALLIVFAPIMYWALGILGAGALLSSFGVVVLGLASRMTR